MNSTLKRGAAGLPKSRLAQALIVSVVLLLVTAVPAEAGKHWCRADPVVSINGYSLQILVGVLDKDAAAVNGPIEVEIGTLPGVPRSVALTDAGFNGHGEVVTFTDI